MRAWPLRCCSPCRTSARVAIARRSRRSGARSRRRACSTCTPTPTTTGRCSRSPARQGELAAGADRRRARGGRAHRHQRPHRRPPARGRARRGAGRLSRRGAPRRRRAPRRSRPPALIGEELGVPVFLYGELATRPEHAERAWIRARRPDGAGASASRRGELVPDYGPRASRTRRAGAVLVAARPPLVAFNVDLVTDDVELAQADRRRAARVGRRPARRARARPLPRTTAAAPRSRRTCTTTAPCRSREIVEYVRERAEVAEAELVGLAPRAAFEGFPDDVPLRGFDPERHILEEALRRSRSASGNVACMAQTKRKRTRKHRGTPAGTIERAGQDRAAAARARTPSRSRASGARSGSTRRRPGAARCNRAAIAAARVRRARGARCSSETSPQGVGARRLHVPALHPARLRDRHADLPLPPARKKARQARPMDVRMFTVGPVAGEHATSSAATAPTAR